MPAGSICSCRDLSPTLKSRLWGSPSGGLPSSDTALNALVCPLDLARASNSSARLAKLPYDGRCLNKSEDESAVRWLRRCSVLSDAVVLLSPFSGSVCSTRPSVSEFRCCPEDSVFRSTGSRSRPRTRTPAGACPAMWSSPMCPSGRARGSRRLLGGRVSGAHPAAGRTRPGTVHPARARRPGRPFRPGRGRDPLG